MENLMTSSPADLIKTALDSIGLAYQIQINPSGHPFAGFGMSTPSGTVFPTTVILQGEWLNVTTYRVVAGPARDNDLKLFTRVNCDWRLGRVYFNPGDDHYQMAVGLDAADGPPPPEALRAVFHHLADAAEALRRYDIPDFQPPPSPVSLADVKGTLLQMGVRFTEDDDGQAVGWGVMDTDGSRYSIQVQIAGDRLLVRGIHGSDRKLTIDRALLDKIQLVNSRVAAGTLQLDLDSEWLYYELALVPAWQPAQPPLLMRAINQVRIVMRHVEQSF
jgi:hypothetical protein